RRATADAPMRSTSAIRQGPWGKTAPASIRLTKASERAALVGGTARSFSLLERGHTLAGPPSSGEAPRGCRDRRAPQRGPYDAAEGGPAALARDAARPVPANRLPPDPRGGRRPTQRLEVLGAALALAR